MKKGDWVDMIEEINGLVDDMNDTPEVAMRNELVDEVLDIVYKYKDNVDCVSYPLYSILYYNYGNSPAVSVFPDRSVAVNYASTLIGRYDVVNFKVQSTEDFE